MGFAEEMKKMGDGIKGSFDARMNFLGTNIVEAGKTLAGARKFVGDCHRKRKIMARKLHADLHGFTEDLKDNVGTMKEKFHREQRKNHQEFRSGHQAFFAAAKALSARRRNFKSEIARAKQKAQHAH